MKRRRGLVGLVLLVAGLLSAARTSGAQKASAAEQNTAVTMPASSPLAGNAVAGKETFTQYCSICHGVGAKGFIGPSIAGIDWTVPGLHAIVRGGLGGYGSMPAFNADVVTDKNIADIAAFLVSLAAAAPSKAATAPQTTAVSPAPPSTIASTVAAASPTTPSAAPSAAPSTAAPSPAAQPVASGAGDPARGHQVYTTNCAACHGANAQGGIGPSLRGEKNRKDTAAAIAWIKNPQPPMPKLYPSVLSEKDVENVAAYVESL